MTSHKEIWVVGYLEYSSSEKGLILSPQLTPILRVAKKGGASDHSSLINHACISDSFLTNHASRKSK